MFYICRKIVAMDYKKTFQSIITLHQTEFPVNLFERELKLPINESRIVTVTGVRRCGKSSLLELTINKLLEMGVPKERILYLGFDDERFMSMRVENLDEILQAYRELFPEQNLKEVYMFFDEIQLIEGWELFVLRVYKNYCKNIYITGSTAQMLSQEMASALRGWPDEYTEYPLSFKEYLQFKGVKINQFLEQDRAILADKYLSYCREGGYPQPVLTETKSAKVKILQSYFNTMLTRDMIEHYNISSSPEVVRYFLKRVMNNLTKPTSVNNIYNELKSQGVKVSKDSLYLWLDYACNIFLFYNLPQYTTSLVKEKATPSKYYVADVGLRNAVLLAQSEDDGKSLENMVYLSIKRTLSDDDKMYYFSEKNECDFVVQRNGKIEELVQVCLELDSDNITREVAGLVAASKVTGCQNCKIVTLNQSKILHDSDLQIKVIPAWEMDF